MFLIGGLTGIMLAMAPFDFQLSDTYFVVGHFHWVLIGGTLFGVFAGIHYWYPKVTGRMLNERLARWQFVLLYVGFMLTFGPMHLAGVFGMPRRIYTYEPDRGWELLNQLTTLGALIQVPSYAIFLYNVVASLRKGRLAGNDPWDAWTLEWATTSPPPSYNFAQSPTVRSRRPLWDCKHPDDPDWKYEGHPADKDSLDAVALDESTVVEASGSTLHPAQWGMIAFLLSEVAFFATLIVTYLALSGHDRVGPTPAEALSLGLVLVTTSILLSSSVTAHFALHSLARNRRGAFLALWGLTILLGALFLAGTADEWRELIEHGLTISRNLFGSAFYTVVGFHALHVTAGVIAMSIVFGLAWKRNVTTANPMGAELVSWYWHFVDVVWVVVFIVVYLLRE
jgi:heme/copper-type cytochrome/quinol oxidase subunit 3